MKHPVWWSNHVKPILIYFHFKLGTFYWPHNDELVVLKDSNFIEDFAKTGVMDGEIIEKELVIYDLDTSSLR